MAYNLVEMISISSRYSSVPGGVIAGGWLSSPQAAGWSSEAGHKTPEERKQQTQGTVTVFTQVLHSPFW